MLGQRGIPARPLGDILISPAAAMNSRIPYHGTGFIIHGDVAFIISDGLIWPTYPDFEDRNLIVAVDWTTWQVLGYLPKSATSVISQTGGCCFDPATELLFISTLGGTNLIFIFDVSDPANMQEVRAVPASQFTGPVTPGFGFGHMAAANNILMVVTGGAGTDRVKRIDYSTPSTASVTGGLTHANIVGANGIAFDGTYAYVTSSSTARLTVLDCTGASPTMTGSVTHASFSQLRGVAILDATKVVVMYQSGMAVVDHTTKATPTRSGGISSDTTNFGTFQHNAFCQDGYAYIGFGDKPPLSVDCTTPSTPVVDTIWAGEEWAYGGDFLGIHGDSTNDRFAIMNYADPNTAAIFDINGGGDFTLAAHEINDFILTQKFIDLGDNLVASVSLSNYLAILDIGDPDVPVVVARAWTGATVPLGPSGRDGIKVGDRLYLTDSSSDSIWIVNITDPFNPSIVTEWVGPLDGVWSIIEIESGHIVAISSDGLAWSLDITDPDDPVILDTLDVTSVDDSPFSSIARYGNFVYFNGFEDRFGIIDYTNAATPVLDSVEEARFSDDSNGLNHVFVHNHYLYVGTYNAWYIYDLDPDPTDPQYIWTVPFWQGLSSFPPIVIGDLAWSIYWYPPDWLLAVVFVMDMTNDERPRIIGYSSEYPNSGWGGTAVGTNFILWEAMGDSDMRIFTVTPIGEFDTIGLVVDTNTAQVITHQKTKTIGQVTETDLAQIVTVTPQRRLVDQATSTETVRQIEHAFDQIPMIVADYVTASDIPQLEGARGIDIQGDYAYIATQASLGGTSDRLTIMNIADPYNMTYVGSVANTNLNDARDVKVSGNYAYVACGIGDRFTIVNVTTPSAPTIAGTITDPLLDGAFAVAILSSTHVAVAASESDTLVVIDVSTPATPTIAGSISDAQLDGATAVDTQNGYAFVTAAATDRLTIVNCNTPSSLSIVGSITDGTNLDNSQGILVFHEYAYVTSSTQRITVIDIRDVTSPTVTGNISDPTLGAPLGLDIQYPYIYAVANGGDNLVAIDVSNPTNPIITDNTDQATPVLTEAWDVAIANNFAFVTTNATGATPNSTGIVAVGGSIIIQARERETAQIITPVLVPQVITSISVGDGTGNPICICTYGTDYVVIGCLNQVAGTGGYIVVVNVSDPANPFIEGQSTPDTDLIRLRSVCVVGDHAFVSAQGPSTTEQCAAYDLSDVSNPTQTHKLITNDSYFSIRSLPNESNYVAVSALIGDEFRILDISNPASLTNPETLTNQDYLQGVYDMQAIGDYMVCNSATDLSTPCIVTVDVTDPLNISIVGGSASASNKLFEAHTGQFANGDLLIEGTWGYVVGNAGSGGLHFTILDLTDPENITEEGYLFSDVLTPGDTTPTCLAKEPGTDIVYVIDTQRVHRFDVSNKTSPVLVATVGPDSSYGFSETATPHQEAVWANGRLFRVSSNDLLISIPEALL